MEYFAHNGISHGSAAGTASRSLLLVIMILLLVTIATASVMLALTYLVHRFTPVTISINQDNKEE